MCREPNIKFTSCISWYTVVDFKIMRIVLWECTLSLILQLPFSLTNKIVSYVYNEYNVKIFNLMKFP
jgi:hypothetical protein